MNLGRSRSKSEDISEKADRRASFCKILTNLRENFLQGTIECEEPTAIFYTKQDDDDCFVENPSLSVLEIPETNADQNVDDGGWEETALEIKRILNSNDDDVPTKSFMDLGFLGSCFSPFSTSNQRNVKFLRQNSSCGDINRLIGEDSSSVSQFSSSMEGIRKSNKISSVATLPNTFHSDQSFDKLGLGREMLTTKSRGEYSPAFRKRKYSVPTIPTLMRLGWTDSSENKSHGSLSGGSEDGAHTIDHDNQAEDEYYRRANGSNSRPSQSLASRMRDIKQDVQKRFSRLRSRSAERLSQRNVASDRQYTDQSHSESTTCEDTYDGESTPTAARSNWTPSYQCKMPRSYSGIPTQTTSAELYAGPFVARARALVDCTPSPYDREALRFKRGDLIDVISMNPSGLWRGRCESRVGHFKFITVELLPDRPSRERRKEIRQKKFSESRANEEEQSLDEILAVKGKPETVEDLLKQIGLEDHISVFVLNGYEELESFLDLDESELDYLGIHDQRKRSRILAAVECLQDQASVSASPPADVSDKQSPAVVDDYKVNTFHRLSFPRDSGCYASNENLHRSSPAASDRSFHSGSQTESGIHLTNEDEVDDECEDDVEPQKRPIEQVLKTKALRDRHTLTARDLVPMVGDGKTINDKNMVDKNFAALVEKYSANEKVTLEGKFLNARSVFEPANPNSPSKNGPSRP